MDTAPRRATSRSGNSPGGKLGGGVDGRARFGYDDFVQTCFGQTAHQLAREFVGFAAGGAVADGNEFDAVRFDEAGEGSERVVSWCR